MAKRYLPKDDESDGNKKPGVASSDTKKGGKKPAKTDKKPTGAETTSSGETSPNGESNAVNSTELVPIPKPPLPESGETHNSDAQFAVIKATAVDAETSEDPATNSEPSAEKTEATTQTTANAPDPRFRIFGTEIKHIAGKKLTDHDKAEMGLEFMDLDAKVNHVENEKAYANREFKRQIEHLEQEKKDIRTQIDSGERTEKVEFEILIMHWGTITMRDPRDGSATERAMTPEEKDLYSDKFNEQQSLFTPEELSQAAKRKFESDADKSDLNNALDAKSDDYLNDQFRGKHGGKDDTWDFK